MESGTGETGKRRLSMRVGSQQSNKSFEVLDSSEDGQSKFSKPRMKAKEPEKSEKPEKNARENIIRSGYGRRYSGVEEKLNKGSMLHDTETSDSEDTEDMATDKDSKLKFADHYDPKEFEDLKVSAEVSELFTNIMRYTPQKIDLRYKLAPFIPDYIPAVGDIDPFLKVPRPDGVVDHAGLYVLDEPAADQSEPAVLNLQLLSQSGNALAPSASAATVVVKRLEDAGKNGKLIDKWIEEMAKLHLNRHQPAVNLVNKFPDADSLLMVDQNFQSPEEMSKENSGEEPSIDVDKLGCTLSESIDLVCSLLDIPVYEGAQIESLHVLFTLYLEVLNKVPRMY